MTPNKAISSMATPIVPPKDAWEYVSIPTENALGEAHCNVTINKDTFEAGKTYLIPPDLAVTLKDRLRVYQQSCIRILQPKRDVNAENCVAVGSASSIGSAAVGHNQFDQVFGLNQ